MTSFPPQRTFKATPLSLLETQTWLATYLKSAETTAFLQPDALLTASGPVSAQGMSSVTMHNLRRLHAGLKGEYNIQEASSLEADDEVQFKGAVVNVDEIYGVENDWQDKSEFEREQSVEVGDIAERDPGKGTSKVQTAAKKIPNDTNRGVDKAARKKAKKERKMQSRKAQHTGTTDD